eukprot:m.1638855 g.1638855  ORF g.1638855 m.1638855 type:complete len:118 (+) comp31516_c0_seq1:466-819(+)
MDSHRILYWAGTVSSEKQEALARELAVGHFTARRSATAPETLLAAAVEVGMDAKMAAEVLANKSMYLREVQQSIEAVQCAGVYSIPVFIFIVGETTVAQISGAQPTAAYDKVLRSIA